MNVYVIPGLDALGGLACRPAVEDDVFSRQNGPDGKFVTQRYILRGVQFNGRMIIHEETIDPFPGFDVSDRDSRMILSRVKEKVDFQIVPSRVTDIMTFLGAIIHCPEVFSEALPYKGVWTEKGGLTNSKHCGSYGQLE